jgi:hypothetical protein
MPEKGITAMATHAIPALVADVTSIDWNDLGAVLNPIHGRFKIVCRVQVEKFEAAKGSTWWPAWLEKPRKGSTWRSVNPLPVVRDVLGELVSRAHRDGIGRGLWGMACWVGLPGVAAHPGDRFSRAAQHPTLAIGSFYGQKCRFMDNRYADSVKKWEPSCGVLEKVTPVRMLSYSFSSQ